MSESGKAIGIDIGGTKIAIAAVDGAGAIHASTSIPTHSKLGIEAGVKRIVGEIETVIASAAWSIGDLCGIGMGCPGPLDLKDGIIKNPYTLPGWEDGNLIRPLAEHFDIPVRLENDADAALLGECWTGAGQSYSHVVMLTFGTGIGGAALVNNDVYRGFDGEHPEIGLIPIDPNLPPDYSGVNGSFESIASGSAISEAGRKAGFANSHGVFAAAQREDPKAQSIIDRAIRAVSVATWTLLHTYVPQRIILGGGLIDEHYNRFAPAVETSIESATLVPKGRISVAKAQLGNQAGIVGAARLVLP